MSDSVGLVVFSILAVVLVFNAGLYFYARRRRPGSQVELLQRAFHSMKEPLAKDNADMAELSRMVRELTDQPDGHSADAARQ